MSTSAGDTRSGIGARLKAGRERMGLTLLQVAEKLHVDPKVLEAVEAERFSEFAAPVYVKGHLKRYSDLVGENTQGILDEHAAATKPVMPDLTQLPKISQHSADPRKLLLPSLVVLIAFALVGTVWWVLQNINASGPEPQTVSADSQPPTPAPALAAPEEVPPSAPSASTEAAATSGARTLTRSNQPTSTPRPRGARGSPDPLSRPPAPLVPQQAAPPARTRAVNVTLKFANDSYVEIYDANGERVFADIGSANSSRTVSGTPPLRVVLGNAPGVTLTINGRAAKVPPSAIQQDSAQFTINRAGRIVRTRPDGG